MAEDKIVRAPDNVPLWGLYAGIESTVKEGTRDGTELVFDQETIDGVLRDMHVEELDEARKIAVDNGYLRKVDGGYGLTRNALATYRCIDSKI